MSAPGEALDEITRSVRRRIRSNASRGESADTEALIREELRRYTESALAGASALPEAEAATARLVSATVSGLGPLQPLMDAPDVEEIWVNAPNRVFAASGGRAWRTDIELSRDELRQLIERMLRTSGRRVDLSSPFVDAHLPDGSCVHVVIPDITAEHPAVNIRKFVVRDRGLHDLVGLGVLSDELAEGLRQRVAHGRNIIVSGATQSGKTTLLRALLGEVPASERIVTLEETFELALVAEDVVALQCRPHSLEGVGEVTLRRLVKEALRMRPDRLVIGEVRGAEALDLLLALNSGIPGMCTIHANSAADALAKLSVLPLLAGENVTSEFTVPSVARCVHTVVHCELSGAIRRVADVFDAPDPIRAQAPWRGRATKEDRA